MTSAAANCWRQTSKNPSTQTVTCAVTLTLTGDCLVNYDRLSSPMLVLGCCCCVCILIPKTAAHLHPLNPTYSSMKTPTRGSATLQMGSQCGMGPKLNGYQALLRNGSSRPTFVLRQPPQHLLRLSALLPPLLAGSAAACTTKAAWNDKVLRMVSRWGPPPLVLRKSRPGLDHR